MVESLPEILAIDYGISKSSAANIIHRKEEYLSDYVSNCNKEIKRKQKYMIVDKKLTNWCLDGLRYIILRHSNFRTNLTRKGETIC